MGYALLCGGAGSGKRGSIELLWENDSSISSFAGQTVALDLSEYTWLVIEYIFSTTVIKSRNVLCYIDGTTEYTLSIGSSTSNRIGARGVVASNTGIEFKDANYNDSTGNNYVIPTRVFGFKGVSA